MINILLSISEDNSFFCGINHQMCTGKISNNDITILLGDTKETHFTDTVKKLIKSVQEDSIIIEKAINNKKNYESLRE